MFFLYNKFTSICILETRKKIKKIAQLIGILLKCWNVCKAYLHKSTSLALVQLNEQELGGTNGILIQADNGK